MSLSVLHALNCPIPDASDSELNPDAVRPSDWNAAHLITQSAGGLLGATASGASDVLSQSDALSLLGLTGVLVSGGPLGTPSSGTLTNCTGLPGSGLTDGTVTYAKIQDVAGLSVVGRSANSSGVSAAITGTDGQVLRVSGTALGFGTIVAAGLASDAVTTVKILDANVTYAKIANGTGLSVVGRSANTGGVNADITGTANQVLAVTGTTLGFTATPIIGTSVTVPTVNGGSAAGSVLTLQSTSGAGTTDTVDIRTGSQALALRVDTAGRVMIGTTSLTENRKFFSTIVDTSTNASEGHSAIESRMNYQPAGDSSANPDGVYGTLWYNSPHNFTGAGAAVRGNAYTIAQAGNAAVNVSTLIGTYGRPRHEAAGTVTDAISIYADGVQNAGTGTVTNSYLLYGFVPTAATNNYGVFFHATPNAGSIAAAVDQGLTYKVTGTGTQAWSTAGSERARFSAAGQLIKGHTASIATVGGADPSIQMHGTDAATSSFANYRWSANANAPQSYFLKSRGASIATRGAVVADDSLGLIQFGGDDGTNFIPAALIRASVDGTPGTNDMPGRLEFFTTLDGAATTTLRMLVDNAGNVVCNTAAIATNAANGFLYIPTCAGTPTGTPTTYSGRIPMIYDTTNHQFWFYDLGWKQPKTPAGAAIVTWQ